ncbi:glycosyltransferase family 4 protein [Amorphoplanes digitatis]|uniref:Glycosyltransferase involved in cell wall biosynthesis n=1 Tax=Actinoplanes digitatis TaxID=1868 RepID=A0A7W7MRK1_9ACTN|nr:glycosyltransferase family 4 protein [Actinoplanes digitatis]MBB4763700.1 glycosyltransferase involved in cell wall biosynthesis [Actinoplanes digitatis]GID93042.1 glycosyl transferase family 1 [Actinoplanes digitatis]
MRISFLVHNVYGVGGTIRTVINLARELSLRHQVEVVSILRRLDRPMLDIGPRISVVGLVDLRPGSADSEDPRGRELSTLVPVQEEFFRFYSRLTDERIADYLRQTSADVVVGTRPALNLCVARLARPDQVRIAQEHMTQDSVPPTVREEMRRHYPALSAAVTVTEADARTLADRLPDGDLPILSIPNSVPDPDITPADGASRIVVAAGRLATVKRYELLVRAFARVVAERPDWSLRIYGGGGQAAPLAALIADLGLHNHVFLMGAYTPLEAEWTKGSIAAVTSAKESFGMTIVEAMRCGLPVLSTACPVGPAEIITDGVDGLLVPVGDVAAIAAGLLRLINDDRLRAGLGRAARENSRRYDPATVAARYEELFARLRPAEGTLTRTAANLAAPVRRLRAEGELALLKTLPGRWRPAAAQERYVGGCRMRGGRVVVEVPRDRLARTMTHLVFRSRGAEPDRRLVRLPLTGAQPGWEATFPADAPLLDEGRWDLFLEDRRGRRHRLRAGRLDVRGLLGGCAETAPFTRNVPYPTTDGFLAVAAWRRERHAELDQIRYGDDAVTVTGRLIAGTFGDRVPRLRLVRRGGPPGDLTVAGTSGGGADFSFDVPLHRLAGLRLLRLEDWDAEVGALDDGAPAPLARLMDDVIERKKTYVYPPVRVDDEAPPGLYEESPAAEVWVRPYLTVQSGLAFAIADREDQPAGR